MEYVAAQQYLNRSSPPPQPFGRFDIFDVFNSFNAAYIRVSDLLLGTFCVGLALTQALGGSNVEDLHSRYSESTPAGNRGQAHWSLGN